MSASVPTTSPYQPVPARPRSILGPGSAMSVALVALLVVTIAPVLRVLYPILYVIGEDWSYPRVGAIGLLLYCAPLAAATVAKLRPAAGLRAGVIACVVAVVLVQAAHPITRWAAGAATVLTLAGVTAVLLRLSGGGVARVALFVGLVLGLALDTAVRGVLRTWDLTWRPGVLPALAMAVLVVCLANR